MCAQLDIDYSSTCTLFGRHCFSDLYNLPVPFSSTYDGRQYFQPNTLLKLAYLLLVRDIHTWTGRLRRILLSSLVSINERHHKPEEKEPGLVVYHDDS